MRPHVELIHEDDHIWRPAELEGITGAAEQRNLSIDEEDGSASTSVVCRTAVTRGPGAHESDTEWFVLEGAVQIGDTDLGAGGYLRAPCGASVPAHRFEEGTRLLVFREGGGWGYRSGDGSDAGEIDVIDSSRMPWVDRGPTARQKILFERGDGRATKLLWALRAAGHELVHHLSWEEAYTLEGTRDYNFGTFRPGTYFYRPPRILHGSASEADARVERPECKWLLRQGGELENYITTERRVEATYRRHNYPDDVPGPVIAGVPVRSRSVGEWDGAGQ